MGYCGRYGPGSHAWSKTVVKAGALCDCGQTQWTEEEEVPVDPKCDTCIWFKDWRLSHPPRHDWSSVEARVTGRPTVLAPARFDPELKDDYGHQGSCRRFPTFVNHARTDVCGEWKGPRQD